MSEEMKNNIMKYMTGNITEQTPDSDITNSNVVQSASNLSSQLYNALGEFSVVDIIQGKDSDGNGLEYNVIYGTYNNKNRGYVAIINETGELIQLITKFTSGANIGRIYAMNVDENGYFYMVEYGLENARVRFVMLNNIILKTSGATEYSINIRRAYAIPNTSALYNAITISKLTKAVGQSKYIIAGTTTQQYNGISYRVPLATQLSINVGAENEWIDYIGDVIVISSTPDSVAIPIDIYATWSGDTLSLIVMGYPQTTPRYVIKYVNSGSYLTYTTIDVEATGYVALWGNNIEISNPTKAYFTLSGRIAGYMTYDVYLYEIDLTNNSSSTLYHAIGYYNVDQQSNQVIKLVKVGTEMFFLEITNGALKYQINVGKIRQDIQYYQDQVKIIDIALLNDAPTEFRFLVINKQFNLYYFNVLIDNNNYSFNQVYNFNNYNGISIEGVKSIIPNTGQLFDENGNIIFARNLYNKVIANNITTSTIQVPNNFLNEINIKNKNLLSYNNNLLVQDTDIITTNEYEVLNINFANTINMINNNDINNPISNITGASSLNNSMNNTLDYSNKQATKIKIYYNDNTTETRNVQWNLITGMTHSYNVLFNINVNKLINEIDIISNDESTTYLTIDGSTLEIGKTYSISQDLYIDFKN